MALKNNNPEHVLTVDEQRKGGKKSGEVRAAKKTIRTILEDILDRDVDKSESQFRLLARALGAEGKTVKEVFTLACVMNSVKRCGLDDLDRMMNLLGESRTGEQNNGILDTLTEWINSGGGSDVEQ